MKLYEDYTKELYSFLADDTTLPSGNLLRLGKKYCIMTFSTKIKTIHNKIEQNKTQYAAKKQYQGLDKVYEFDKKER